MDTAAADQKNNIVIINDSHKHLFRKMIDMDIPPTIIKRVMSFWMFLESVHCLNGYQSFCQNLLLADKSVIKCVSDQSQIVLSFLESDAVDDNIILSKTPAASASASAAAVYYYYYYVYRNNRWVLVSSPLLFPNYDVFVGGDKRRASDQIMDILTNVCNVGFEDIIEMKGLKCSSTEEEEMPRRRRRMAPAFKLNPAAEEWSPPSVPHDQRSLFMTFSKGHPVSKAEIVMYFGGVYGECVEDVYIHKPRGGSRIPEFGKIVFKTAMIAYLVLQNQEFIIYHIGNQKTIGLKRYRPSSPSPAPALPL